MLYVMSDIHGCYGSYRKMLDKIALGEDDTLFVLGDVIDRGEDGIKILLDMMQRANVVPILGNHEYMAYRVLKKFNVEITEENYATQLDAAAMEMYENWMLNGGITTLRAFRKLSLSQRDEVIDYLGEFGLYEELCAGGSSFVLVHGGLTGFDTEKDLDEYSIHDMIWDRCDYEMQYFPDRYLVTGHTPTHLIAPEYKGRIYKKNNHIAIDCGVMSGGRLGCICLDNMAEFYV